MVWLAIIAAPLIFRLPPVPPSCFPRDTLVATETGLRPIGQIQAAERVWAFDFKTGSWHLAEVECRHDSEYEGLLISIDIGSEVLTATAHHPFWVIEGEDLEMRPPLRRVGLYEDRFASLPGRWVNSHDLRRGDVLFTRERGCVTVQRIWQREEHISVCNLTVRDLHNFAVGESEMLVHNGSGSGPQGVGNRKRSPKPRPEHRKNPNPANLPKHQKGQRTFKKCKGGEKKDPKMPYQREL